MDTQSTTLELKVDIRCSKSLRHSKLKTQTKAINCWEKAFGAVETVSGNEGIGMKEGAGLMDCSYQILADDDHQFVGWTNSDPAIHRRNRIVPAFSRHKMAFLAPS